MDGPKVVLVTGSSSGIGEATVKLFAQKGYRVVVCGSRKERVEQVARECAKLGQQFEPLALVLDFSLPENGELAVKKTVEHFGRLDVLINNAGVFAPTPYASGSIAYEKYKETMTINTDATVRASLAACEHLKKTRGCLLFNSSVASRRALGNSFAYCMSKAAMSMLAKCLAIDLAPHVRVNVVSPGPVKTEILARSGAIPKDLGLELSLSATTLLERIGDAGEIASVFYYLASDESSFISGEDVVVDGGYSLKLFSSTHNAMK